MRNDHRNYRATLCVVMPFRTLRVLLATQSVETCIPTLERGNDHRNYRAALCVVMPFRTLCVLPVSGGRRISVIAQPKIFLKNTCMSDHELWSAALS
ncbi:hypothetical protein E0H95_09825 [Pseudomonas syringae pv. tomato]|nr:hypothetical protein [Pseudomonas syringae pv. tomato]